MNELMNNEFNMNHVELCELINRLRVEEGNRKELAQRDFIKKIRKEVETLKTLGLEGVRNFSHSQFEDSQGKKHETFLMNRDGILQIASSESVYVRAKIIEYINALENKLKEQIPQLSKEEQLQLAILNGDKETSLLALKEYKNVITQPLLDTIEELEPKAKYADDVLNSDKLLSTTEIAKDLGISARKLNNLLNEMGVIYKQGNTWFLYSKYQDKIGELADYKVSEYGQLLKWTEQGRKFIIELLNKKGE